ncbi:zinc finger BED domain-containing protein 5 [Trichonephila clavata]|uniref:Zinc finger BED domain-containing protein 5 n=1 Tax=Trichonephila clavata TaxID=2740835 RepID=A0A8X6HZF8_TRICU|nr:zinc finger BED domain-containing protein 5 [Trichonephila clavata]
MDRRLENGSLKKTDAVCSNAEIAESTDIGTRNAIHFQLHTATATSSNFGQVVSTKRRTHDTSYLSFGFTTAGDEEAPDAVCLLCNKYWRTAS